MKNWQDDICSTQADFEDALLVCNKLNIPLYTVDFSKEYKEKVFKHFIEGYRNGTTPNPDILCNKEIKFKLLLDKAKKLNADFLATGHYAQINNNLLKKAKDLSKDQSYFLYTLKKDVLKNILFPIGSLYKKEIREIAKKNDLITHNKKDSTGICFIGERDFKDFLAKYIKPQEGNIETTDKQVIGKHMGAFFYTLGQRKGLNIGGASKPWFVVDKDIERNVVIVAQGENNPKLFSTKLIAKDVSWVNKAPKTPCKCLAKVRYRQQDQECIINKIEKDKIYISFENPQRAVTPQQSIVFYDKDICLGGAIIDVFNSLPT